MDKYREFLRLLEEQKEIPEKEVLKILNLKSNSNLSCYYIKALKEGYQIELIKKSKYKTFIYKGKTEVKNYIKINELKEKFKGKKIHKDTIINLAIHDKSCNGKSVKTIVQELIKSGVKVVGI